MELHGKVALVTGGAVRVGKAIAVALARSGADIAFSYHTSRDAARETQQEVESLGRRVLARQADAASVSECRQLVDAAVEHFGRLDVLVNSASLWKRTKFAELKEEDWNQVTDIMLKGAAFTSHAAAPHLAAHGDGAIVNIVDLSAFVPFPNLTVHSVGKAGLLNLTYGMAMELAPAVRVNAVAPGLVLPPPNYTEKQVRAAAARNLLGRWGSAEDVASAVLFLVQASFITGTVIEVDGGEHIAWRR